MEARHGATIRVLRRMLLAVLLFGMAGAGSELALIGHYDDGWQVIPLVLLGGGGVAAVWVGVCPGAAAVAVLRVVMIGLLLGGGAGVVLHYRASAEFHAEAAAYRTESAARQGESGGAAEGWAAVRAVLSSKVPPTLAPGLLVQLGLIGLTYTYRHPALNRRADVSAEH
ncbi:hypothetical protein RAS1_30890 [Phycisphaerae bacterium RAS1]|nr:hypothetical protein RAS1_30890 [Phycisphaerae bacterium RAS1]